MSQTSRAPLIILFIGFVLLSAAVLALTLNGYQSDDRDATANIRSGLWALMGLGTVVILAGTVLLFTKQLNHDRRRMDD